MDVIRRSCSVVRRTCARCVKRRSDPPDNPTFTPHGGEINDVFVADGNDSGRQRMKALFDFEAMQHGDLSFRQGERLLVTVE